MIVETTKEGGNSTDSLFEEFNTSFAVVNVNGTPMVLEDWHKEEKRDRKPEEFIFSSFNNFKNLYVNRTYAEIKTNGKGDVISKVHPYPPEWLAHPGRREYMNGIIFDPANKQASGYKNLWTGLAIDPDPTVPPSLYLEHLFSNVCCKDQNLYDYLLNYFAHAVQKPWELPAAALVLRGEKGVGKGSAIAALKYIFGDHFYQTQDKEKVLGKFNTSIQNKLIVYLNECTWDSYNSMDSVLKGRITESTNDIEPKGVDSYQVANYLRLIIDSDGDYPVPATNGDRRYVFINVGNAHRCDNQYFAAIDKELKNGGAEGLLHLLLSRDITNYSPRELPKGNATRGADMAVRSMPPIDEFIHGWLLDDGNLPDFPFNMRIRKNQLYEECVKHCQSRRVRVPAKATFYARLPQVLGCITVKANGYDCFKFPPMRTMQRKFQEEVLKRNEDWSRSDLDVVAMLGEEIE